MKYVLVTGGAVGLGAELVNVFASNGYNVIIGYKSNGKKASVLIDKIKSKYNVNVVAEYIDIVDEKNVNNIFNNYDIDILINNAALCMDNNISNKSFSEFMEVIKVNLGGTYLMCKYASNVSTIINISSKDGIDTYNPISLDYSASKAGIINLSKNLSLCYLDKRILCICPGWINTESVLEMNPDYLKNEMKRVNQSKLLDKHYVAKKIFDIYNSKILSGSVVEINE